MHWWNNNQQQQQKHLQDFFCWREWQHTMQPAMYCIPESDWASVWEQIGERISKLEEAVEVIIFFSVRCHGAMVHINSSTPHEVYDVLRVLENIRMNASVFFWCLTVTEDVCVTLFKILLKIIWLKFSHSTFCKINFSKWGKTDRQF